MNRAGSLWRIVGLAALGAWLVGCAVLRVDVDVYKGPLANHEEVQMEQLAVMAIGAKPLLIQISNSLHYAATNKNSEESAITTLVNEIATLYDDRSSKTTLDNLVREAEATFADFQNATNGYLRPGSELWQQYKKSGEPGQALLEPLKRQTAKIIEQRDAKKLELNKKQGSDAQGDGAKQKLQSEVASLSKEIASLEAQHQQIQRAQDSVASGLEELTQGYEHFLTNEDGKRYDARIIFGHRDLHDVLPRLAGLPEINKLPGLVALTKLPARDVFGAIPDGEDMSANGFFMALSDPAVVGTHAQLLFPGNIDKQPFIQRVTEISKSFLKYREALNDQMRISLMGIEEIGSSFGSSRLRPLAMAASRLMQPQYLNVALQAIPEGPESPAHDLKVDPRQPAKQLRESLVDQLVEKPQQTARALLQVDTFLKTAPAASLQAAGVEPKFTSAAKRKFGIASGDPGETDLKTIASGIREAVDVLTTFSFAKGRLNVGLDRLIENYLNAIHTDSSNSIVIERRRLVDGLIGFAEKILVVVNNQPLITGIITDKKTREQVEKSLLVLQSVGNSILVQADELRHRESQKKQLQTDTEREAAAQIVDPLTLVNNLIRECESRATKGNDDEKKRFTEAANQFRGARTAVLDVFKDLGSMPAPSTILWELQRILEKDDKAEALDALKAIGLAASSQALHPESAKDVLDQLIASLRHQHLQAVLEFGPNSTVASNITATLEAAYEQRARMVYIRPPAAFLRNSYPATSLQGDPELGWYNMLSRHAMRSLPFYHPCEGGKTKVVAEIDKQYWQNINSVRVAGGGHVNYVVAKDDVGNWYVKSYSADPSNVVKSAKNLALFSAGAGMKTDLIGRVRRMEAGQTGGAPASDTSLGRVFSKYSASYDRRTQTDFDYVKGLVTTNLTQRIDTAWDAHSETKANKEKLLEQLRSATNAQLGPIRSELQKNLKPEEQPGAILSAAAAIRRFHNSLLANIEANTPVWTKAPEEELAKKQLAVETSRKAFEEAQAEAGRKMNELAKAKERLEGLNASDPAAADAQKDVDRLEKEVSDANDKAKQREAELKQSEEAAATAKKEVEAIKASASIAIQEVKSIARQTLAEIMERREAAAKEFETAIIFVGDAIKQ